MTFETLDIPIKSLKRNTGQIPGVPKNPRIIKDNNFKKLKDSIVQDPEMLELREIIAYKQGDDYIIIGGNMRFEALKALNFDKAKCKVITGETTAEQLKRIILKDNSAYGEWDFDELANEWEEALLNACAIDIPVFDEPKLEDETEEDKFDETKETIPARCSKGEIWQLGRHRLMCGYSTDGGAVALLMNGEKADISFFSPPYNAGFGANITKDNGRSKYTNGSDDNMPQDKYADFLNATIANANTNSQFTFCNIQMLANNKKALFSALQSHFERLADIIIWDKCRSQPAAAANVLNSEFEFVFVFSKKANRNIGTIPFHGTLKNIIHINPSHNEYADVHNAVFPMELAAYFVQNFAKESVLDLFGGTGTTLVAAEQLNRKCFMMELDAHYCDIIIARWEKLTGRQAVKLGNINEPKTEAEETAKE